MPFEIIEKFGRKYASRKVITSKDPESFPEVRAEVETMIDNEKAYQDHLNDDAFRKLKPPEDFRSGTCSVGRIPSDEDLAAKTEAFLNRIFGEK